MLKVWVFSMLLILVTAGREEKRDPFDLLNLMEQGLLQDALQQSTECRVSMEDLFPSPGQEPPSWSIRCSSAVLKRLREVVERIERIRWLENESSKELQQFQIKQLKQMMETNFIYHPYVGDKLAGQKLQNEHIG